MFLQAARRGVGLSGTLLDVSHLHAVSHGEEPGGRANIGKGFLMPGFHATADHHAVAVDGVLVAVPVYIGHMFVSNGFCSDV